MVNQDLTSVATTRTVRAFTLVELLVGISIISIMTILTVAVVSTLGDHDRIRSSASTIQSAILGARDRAVRAGRDSNSIDGTLRGLRFIVEENLAGTSTSMVYIGNSPDWTDGKVNIHKADFTTGGTADTPETHVVISRDPSKTNWFNLKNQGLLQDGARIKIPNTSSGQWYRVNINHLTSTSEVLVLTRLYGDPDPLSSGLGVRDDVTYRLQLSPSILPGQEPVKLSSGIVIDLDRSSIQLTPPNPTGTFDILFSPKGNVSSTNTNAKGIINILISSVEDKTRNPTPLDQAHLVPVKDGVEKPFGERFCVSLFSQTGAVITFPIDVTDVPLPGDGFADNPFRFVKTGGAAGR